MKIKKIIAAVTSAVMLFCSGAAFPANAVDISLPAAQTQSVGAVVDSGTCGENLNWTLDDEGTLTISGEGKMTDWSSSGDVPWYSNRKSIKKVIIEKGVTSIGEWAFDLCTSLTSIIIPDSVTSIGNSAFWCCTSLTSITIPDSVTSIGAEAFYNCTSLTSITIPDSVTNIGTGVFASCISLTSITIPDSVTSIVHGAFYSCSSLTSVTIPYSVTSIGKDAFNGCTSLISITIPDSVASMGEWAFCNCKSLTSITILNPDCSIEDKSTICNGYDSGNCHYTGIIRGYSDSTAQAYAEKYGRTFESIGDAPITTTTTTTNTTTTTTTTSTTTTKPTTTTSTTTATTTSKTTTSTSSTTARTTTMTTTTTAITTTTIRTIESGDITIYIGETVAVPGIDAKSTENFSVDGENVTGLKIYEQPVKVNGEYRTLSIIPPEVTVYANDKKIHPGGTVVYEEGLTLRFVVNNYFGGDLIEENPTWKIYEEVINPNTGKPVDVSSNWAKLTADKPDSMYTVPGNILVIDYKINSAPAEDLTGYLGWRLKNGHSIYFKDNSFTISLTAPEIVYGDANGDGEIKLNDAVLIMQALSNPNKFGIDGTDDLHITSDGWANADCNNPGDGVTGKDALAIQKFTLDLIKSLPEE